MSNVPETPNQPAIEASRVTGIVSIGCIITGVGGIILALTRHDPGGPGMCLIASALAFGLLANAVLRK
jgi:hypothetical protein